MITERRGAIADVLIARCSAECAGDRAEVFHTLVHTLVRMAASSRGCAALLGIAIETLIECQEIATEHVPFTEAAS